MPELTDRVFALAAKQCSRMDRALSDSSFAKSLTSSGKLETSGLKWWCSGFYAGSLWKVYEYRRDPRFLKLARKHTLKMSRLTDIHTDHDIGFMVMCSYGNAYRLTRDPQYLPVLESSAATLASRFNPHTGTTRSWDGEWTERNGWKWPVIIDNMMNLELLMEGWRLFGADSLRDIAVAHAKTTAKNHFREDFSTWHLVDYDPADGSVRSRKTRQGFSDDSMWARGEAWALYGYVTMFKRSGNVDFLTLSQAIASLLESRLPQDGIPYWDFSCEDYKDASAAAIMASAFVQLYELDGNPVHLRMAEKQLRALAGPEYLARRGTNGGFLLKHCVGNMPAGSEVDVPLSYADYYFLEALLCYRRATEHPRLLLDDREFAELRAQIRSGKNPVLARMHELIMKTLEADDTLALERKFDASHTRILGQSRKALRRIFNNAYAFRYTGDSTYLKKAEQALEQVCAFEDWNYKHYLDVAEMSTAVALGYDWLYSSLKPSTREAVSKAVNEFAFETSLDTTWAWYYRHKTNWNQVCNGGLVAAALALRDDCDTTSGRVLLKAVANNLPVVEAIYSPDGNYAEGPHYWNYGTTFQTLMHSCLDSALGADFGMSNVPGFSRTADYKLYSYGATHRMFNYFDNGEAETPSCALWYFAQRFRSPQILHREMEFLQDDSYFLTSDNALLPLFASWAVKVSTPEIKSPEGHFYRGGRITPVVMARGDWSSSESDWYLGLKGGSGSTNHSHLDEGSFVFDAFGTRWAADFGTFNYNQAELLLKKTGGNFWKREQDSQRWTVPLIGNKWHNTITVNGARHHINGLATIDAAFDGPQVYGGTVDLTDIVPELDRAVRTVTTDGASLTVVDSLSSGSPARVCWTMVTCAQAEAQEDCVILSGEGGRRMRLEMKGPRKCVYSIREEEEAASRGKMIIDIDFRIPSGLTVAEVTLKTDNQ